MNTVRNFCSDPTRPSFLEELYQGHFRWDLINRFPVQDLNDADIGDRLTTQLTAMLADQVDPDAVDRNAALPDGLLQKMAADGWFKLQSESAIGGKELSHYNTFRVVETAARHCVSVGLSIAIENSLGASAYLSIIPEGPLRDAVQNHVAEGGFSCSADTEPQGAANRKRFTTATPINAGESYLINGQKVFVGHAPIAGLINVSATVHEGTTEQIRRFFIDANSPGVTAGEWHEFMGIKGFPNGWIRFDNVRVPADRMLPEAPSPHELRGTPASWNAIRRGRLHLIAASTLAMAKNCVHSLQSALKRRIIDGRQLSGYQAVREQAANSLADVFAMETIAQWSLLHEDDENGLNVRLEQNVAKNTTSLLCWGIVDRTMSLLAAEGYETASSKAHRGAHTDPIERIMRDARSFRISGGVDFQVDNWMSQLNILSYYYPEPEHATELLADAPEESFDGAALTQRNLDHLHRCAVETRRFGRTCLDLARRNPNQNALREQEHVLILIASVAREISVMALVLARASSASNTNSVEAEKFQSLADIFCTSATHRIEDLHRRITAERAPATDAVVDSWLEDLQVPSNVPSSFLTKGSCS